MKAATIRLTLIVAAIIASNQVSAVNLHLARFLKTIPSHCTQIVTSAHRTQSENKRVGGVKNSLHLQDKAIDLVTNCRIWVINNARLKAITVIVYKKHLHLDIRAKCLVKIKSGYRKCRI